MTDAFDLTVDWAISGSPCRVIHATCQLSTVSFFQ